MLASGCSVLVMRDAPAKPVTEPTCSDSRIPAVIDALISIPFFAFAISFVGADADTKAHADGLPQLSGAIGVGFAASSVLGFVFASGCETSREAWAARPLPQPPPPPAAPVPPLVEAVAAKDPEAARLAREAHAAAFADDCGPTMANGPRVQALDPEYYEKVFLADAAIARCR